MKLSIISLFLLLVLSTTFASGVYVDPQDPRYVDTVKYIDQQDPRLNENEPKVYQDPTDPTQYIPLNQLNGVKSFQGNITFTSSNNSVQIIPNYFTAEIDLKTDNNGFSGDINWSQIQNFPVSCSVGFYVQGVGTTLNCVALPSGSGSDTNKVGVTGNDTTPDFLLSKLQAGNGVTLTLQNPGGDENILISATGSVDTNCSVTGSCSNVLYKNTDINVLDVNATMLTVTATEAFAVLVETASGADRFRVDTSSNLVYTSTIRPLSDGGQDVGQNVARFRDGWFSRDINSRGLNATDINGNTICLGGDCRTVWPSTSGTDTNCAVSGSCPNVVYQNGDANLRKLNVQDLNASINDLNNFPSSFQDQNGAILIVDEDNNRVAFAPLNGQECGPSPPFVLFKWSVVGDPFDNPCVNVSTGSGASSLIGTANQIQVTNGTGKLWAAGNTTLTLAQDINRNSNVKFRTLSVDDLNASVQDLNNWTDVNAGLQAAFVNIPGDTMTGTLNIGNGDFFVQKTPGGSTVFRVANASGVVQTGDLQGTSAGMYIGTRAIRYGQINAQTADFSGDVNVMDVNAANVDASTGDVNGLAFNCKQTDYSNGCLNIAANTPAFMAAGSVAFDFNNSSKALEFRNVSTGETFYQFGFSGASAKGMMHMSPQNNVNPTFAQQPRKEGVWYFYDPGTVLPKYYTDLEGWKTFGSRQDQNLVVDKNIFGQLITTGNLIGVSCNTTCGAWSYGGPWVCVEADSVAGAASTCTDVTVAHNCMCRN